MSNIELGKTIAMGVGTVFVIVNMLCATMYFWSKVMA